jgi:hypothetical protein
VKDLRCGVIASPDNAKRCKGVAVASHASLEATTIGKTIAIRAIVPMAISDVRQRLRLPRRSLALLRSLLAMTMVLSFHRSVLASAAEVYNPPWVGELNWARQEYFAEPLGSLAPDPDNFTPWFQNRVAHPVDDYTATQLPVGTVRLDSVLDVEYALHRPLAGWTVTPSADKINNVYSFTPGRPSHQDRTGRSGQNAYFNFGAHPIDPLTADIGVEMVGNYDDRYWFPVNDEHRIFNSGHAAKIVRGEAKYDTPEFMIRGFDGAPVYGWTNQNDLFQLLTPQYEKLEYRAVSGKLVPRGGEVRATTPAGTLTVLGGTEIRWNYGSSAYAKYDAPTFMNLEQSIVYRNQNIPFGLEGTDERRWAVSYNASYLYSDRLQLHAGLLYQPFRLGKTYQTPDSTNLDDVKTLKRKDAFGALIHSEIHPTRGLDLVGLGYTYEGPAAGDKHEVDANASRTFLVDWTLAASYLYRQPVIGPVPMRFEGTLANPGAFLSIPRGPDDPFGVHWDNRKAHILSLTLIFDPTPATTFFRYQPNILEDWNLNPEEDSRWTAAVQYRMTHYLSNTDRLYYWDQFNQVTYDPVSYTNSGARATSHPFSSATGLVHFHDGQWNVVADLSGGEALAGSGIAYTSATNFYKPSTIYLSGGLKVQYDGLKAYVRYGQDVYGPLDYFTSLGWTYHKIYQAGLSAEFLRDFETGVRYVGTRMTNDFIGSNVGAFNEYQFYLTYHFTWTHDFSAKFKSLGRPLPQAFPEASVEMSATQLNPNGSGSLRSIALRPQTVAEAGLLNWKLLIRNEQGSVVRRWEGNGAAPKELTWDGAGLNGKPLPSGVYRVVLEIIDLYGNEASSPIREVSLLLAEPRP